MKRLLLICLCLLLTLPAACAKKAGTAPPAVAPSNSPASSAAEDMPPKQNDTPPKQQAAEPQKPDAPASQDEEKPEKEPVKEEPKDEVFCLSFVGDCTLGTDFDTYGTQGSFVALTGDNYVYPFTYASKYFENDDFTMINLECAFTNYNVPEQKTYRFRGPPEYAKILSGSGVECASLANNHSGDYGKQGLSDTKAALDAENVAYVTNGGTLLYTAERGLKIGVCAYFSGAASLVEDIKSLRESGAQLVIAAFHFGDEGFYTPTDYQRYAAHAAIDAGADLVVGSHPHVLQKTEKYKDRIIYYSLGNFSFGGNRNPTDKDTAIMRQYVTLSPDGTVTLGEMAPVPFRLSSVPHYNDYCPMPYDEGSAEYERVLGKLDGSIVPAPLVKPPAPEEEKKEEPTEASPDTPVQDGAGDAEQKQETPPETETPTEAPETAPEETAPTAPPDSSQNQSETPSD